ncbi:MAG: hypothetical protein RLZZ244_1813 [Verrucomicrobiota bacterium]|jgi:hypothetical protein
MRRFLRGLARLGSLFKMKSFFLAVLAIVGGGWAARAADTTLFEQNFESVEAGALPKEFLPLAGEFQVRVEGGNHLVELPGSPLDTYGALFGPSHGDSGVVEGRFRGTKQGRKFPTFGISLRGAGGYRLQVSPGKGQLEIYKGDEPLVGVPFTWESGSWTWLRLSLRKAAQGSGWLVEGWVWKEGEKPPQEASVKLDLSGDPAAGRAAIWGSPYAGTPIYFDDLKWVSR